MLNLRGTRIVMNAVTVLVYYAAVRYMVVSAVWILAVSREANCNSAAKLRFDWCAVFDNCQN